MAPEKERVVDQPDNIQLEIMKNTTCIIYIKVLD